jgi:hypothetical protein
MNMVMMYGMPPDRQSPRFTPPEPQVVPGAVGPLVPLPPGHPPVTHNPFTGEPVNVLEMLAQNAVLKDENKRLTDIVGKQVDAIKKLQQQAGVDRSSIATLESKLIDLETRYNAPRSRNMSDTKVNLFLADGTTPAGWANVPAEIDGFGNGAPPVISIEGKLYRFIPQLVGFGPFIPQRVGFGPVPTPSYAEVVPVVATMAFGG